MAVDELHCPHSGVEDEGDGDTVGDLGDVIDSKSIYVTVVRLNEIRCSGDRYITLTLYVNPIVAIVKKAVSWSVNSLKFTSFRAEIECTPTITKAQVVAASGMMPTNCCTNSSDNRKAAPVTMEATPVRAPASTPVLDSTKQVMELEPMRAPKTNPNPSTHIPRFTLVMASCGSPYIAP